MKQNYQAYTRQDHKVWSTLFNRQKINLQNKASANYLSCLQEMYPTFNAKQICNFDEVNKLLFAKTGWTIEVVKGLIPVDEFFELLAQRKFCSSTWLRNIQQLDYLEEPDMFHDTFGHLPLLMNPEFANFMELFGKTGLKFKEFEDVVVQLQRLYWYTIEFGLMGTLENPKIFGAGIISSYGETNHVFEKNLDIRNFNMEEVVNLNFKTDEIQTTYFVVPDFKTLMLEMMAYTKSLEAEIINLKNC